MVLKFICLTLSWQGYKNDDFDRGGQSIPPPKISLNEATGVLGDSQFILVANMCISRVFTWFYKLKISECNMQTKRDIIRQT